MPSDNYLLNLTIPRSHNLTKDYLNNSLTILQNAVHSSESFLKAYEELRTNNGTRGAPTDHQQDLLRASLIFACAGVDALIKQLVRDALPEVIKKDEGARQQLTDFVKKSLLNKEKLDLEIISGALLAPEPTAFFESRLCYMLTSDSLQSIDQIFKVGSYFNIKSSELTSSTDELKEVYKIRNEITHEMDVDLIGVNRKRRPRKFSDMKKLSITVLSIGIKFYSAVSVKIKQPSIAK